MTLELEIWPATWMLALMWFGILVPAVGVIVGLWGSGVPRRWRSALAVCIVLAC